MDEPSQVHTGAVWRLAMITFVGGLGGGVVFPIIPIEGLKLGISAVMVGVILSLNRVTRLLVNPLTGILVDRFGPRLPLTLGLVVEACATFCYSAGLHGNATFWFLLGRGLWGVGSSLLMVGAMTAALLLSDTASRGMATAKVRMGLSFGMPGGLVLGGLIASMVSPNAAFMAASVITLGGMLSAYWFVPRGAAGTSRAPQSWSRRNLAAGWRTLKQLLRPGPLWFVWMFNFLMFFSVQGVILASLVLVVEERHLSVAGLDAQGTSGLLMAVMIATSAMMALLIGRLLDRGIPRTNVLLPASCLLACGYALLALAPGIGLTALALCLMGISLGGINIPLMVILGDLTTPDRYGRTVSIYQVLGDLGGSFGPITGLVAINHFGSRNALLTIAALALVTIPLAMVLRARELRRV